MLKCLIVDDEELARKRLLKLLEDHHQQVEIIGEASDGYQAVALIESLKPDLVFLDIQMPGKTGFEVLDGLKHDPLVIFTTAYDQYALKAFEENAVGYLLKPIEREQLKGVLQKVDRNGFIPQNLQNLLSQIQSTTNQPNYLKRIQVKLGDRILLIDANDILYFESQDKYTNVQTIDHQYIIDNTLVELETKLDPEVFMRIHRSTLVNVKWIAEIQRYIGGKLQVQLKDEKKTLLVVSRSYTDRVRSL